MEIFEHLPDYDPNGLLIDKHAGFYRAQPNGNAFVYVSKYVVKSADFTPGEIGASHDTEEAYMVKETNISNIGGGLMTFERHYAAVPEDWISYEPAVYVKQRRQDRFGDNPQIVINPEAAAINEADLSEFVSYTETLTTLAKAERKYYREDEFDEELHLQLDQPYHIDPVDWRRVRPDSFRVYMPGIYEVTSYLIEFKQ